LWYRDVVGDQVSLDVNFYSGTDCTAYVGSDSLSSTPSGADWQQLTGDVEAPSGTQSVLFALSVSAACADYCPLAANFDDVSVDDTAITTPIITSFSPTTGWFRGDIWIYGFNFADATSVTFNGTEAQFSIQTDRSIVAYVPNGATTGPISVTTANGTGWSSSSLTLVPPPRIDSFTPTGGAVGTTVDIHGAYFTGATEVDFNDFRVDSFTVDSDSEIHATVPYGAKTGPISVRTNSGYGYSSSSFTVPTPTITSFAPTSGPFGTSVDIRGSNFTGTMWVTFGGSVKANEFTVDSDSEIHATVPSGGQTGYFYVVTPNGSATSPSRFTVTDVAPTISSFTPTNGPAGTDVDIWGSGFTAAASVKFNGTAAVNYTVDSDLELHATVPEGATTGPISVTNPYGTATGSSPFAVTTPPTPTISSFTPTTGPAGTSVDIQGATFTGATSVMFNGTADPNFVVNSPTHITARVPAGPTTGPISVTTSAGTGTSTESFTVIPPPTISSFTPTSGPVGTSVLITGTGLTGASNVTFNGAAASYTVNSPTSITATVPNGATTGPISVTTPGGTGTSSTSFTVIAPPKITTFSPTSGHAGQQVTITGTSFAGATSVQLGKTAAKFTVNSPTKITATVPTITRGNYRWSVTNPAGTAISTGAFHVT
jgi:hypothetical protein